MEQSHTAPAIGDGELAPVGLASPDGSAGREGRFSGAGVRQKDDAVGLEFGRDPRMKPPERLMISMASSTVFFDLLVDLEEFRIFGADSIDPSSAQVAEQESETREAGQQEGSQGNGDNRIESGI